MMGTPAASSVIDGLHRLRHDAVVGGHHQDDDVGDLGSAGTHEGERLVARSIQEDHLTVSHIDVVGADVLGDPSRLAGSHLRLANGVEERGLPVVDVAHDSDDGSAGDEVLRPCFGRLKLDHLLFERLDRCLVAELATDVDGEGGFQGLVHGHHEPPAEQGLHDVPATWRQASSPRAP